MIQHDENREREVQLMIDQVLKATPYQHWTKDTYCPFCGVCLGRGHLLDFLNAHPH